MYIFGFILVLFGSIHTVVLSSCQGQHKQNRLKRFVRDAEALDRRVSGLQDTAAGLSLMEMDLPVITRERSYHSTPYFIIYIMFLKAQIFVEEIDRRLSFCSHANHNLSSKILSLRAFIISNIEHLDRCLRNKDHSMKRMKVCPEKATAYIVTISRMLLSSRKRWQRMHKLTEFQLPALHRRC